MAKLCKALESLEGQLDLPARSVPIQDGFGRCRQIGSEHGHILGVFPGLGLGLGLGLPLSAIIRKRSFLNLGRV